MLASDLAIKAFAPERKSDPLIELSNLQYMRQEGKWNLMTIISGHNYMMHTRSTDRALRRLLNRAYHHVSVALLPNEPNKLNNENFFRNDKFTRLPQFSSFWELPIRIEQQTSQHTKHTHTHAHHAQRALTRFCTSGDAVSYHQNRTRSHLTIQTVCTRIQKEKKIKRREKKRREWEAHRAVHVCILGILEHKNIRNKEFIFSLHFLRSSLSLLPPCLNKANDRKNKFRKTDLVIESQASRKLWNNNKLNVEWNSQSNSGRKQWRSNQPGEDEDKSVESKKLAYIAPYKRVRWTLHTVSAQFLASVHIPLLFLTMSLTLYQSEKNSPVGERPACNKCATQSFGPLEYSNNESQSAKLSIMQREVKARLNNWAWYNRTEATVSMNYLSYATYHLQLPVTPLPPLPHVPSTANGSLLSLTSVPAEVSSGQITRRCRIWRNKNETRSH